VLNATKTVLKKINFKRNATRDAAGGLYVKGNSHILITQCKFEYNRSINGGAGIQIDLSNAVITNCLFVNNKCNIGIIENTGVCTPVIANSTFSHNVSQGAISIWANSTPTITNNIIYNHIGDKIFGNIPSTTQINNNIIEGGYSGNGIVGNILNQDPLFVNAPLDLQLQRCSPAIDYGVNANIPLGTSTDYIGNNRIFNNTVDIGAYELQNVQAIYNVAYVDSAYGNDNNTGNSWVSAFKTLSHALKAMQQLGCYQTADSILVAKGTYYPTGVQNGTNRDSTFLIKRGGIKLYGGFPSGGGTFAQRTLPITGDNTILSGDIGTSGSYDDNSYHVMVIVDINGIADSVVVDGFSITSSQANNNNLYVYASTSTALYKCNGGGIMIQNVNLQNKLHITNNKFYNNKGYFGAGFYNWNASPRVSNCIFTNNNAESDGGGFYNRTYSSPTIINCTYSNNTASNKGGAMENYDFSSPNIFNSTFNNNTATQSGGAIAISNQSSASIHNSLFSNNIASQDGGAINNNQSTLNAYNCTLKNNSALHGGALSDNNGATSNISHCTITNNSAIDNGGGMYNYNATSNVSYSVFSDNLMNGHLSGSGGAFCINATTTSDANFNNCVFNNNTATGIHTRSGAIQVIKGNVNVKNSTFFNNTTNSLSFPNTNAFDVIPPATANLYNTIIWNNSSQTIPYSGNLNYYNSLIQNATVVAPNINVNPKFINSDNPIGPDNIWGTADDGLQLSSCSPAVNIGNNINIPTNIIVDLIGNNRIFNSTVDLGAYESQVIPMPVTGTEVVTICQGQSYTFNGINYSSNNNTAKDTFVTAGGCDSIVTLNLIVAPALTHTINPSICQGQSYSFGGTNYTTTQTGIQHTFVTTGGCDSIVTLNLMVSASITGTEVVTICQGQSYTFNGINYSSNNNTAKDTFVTTGGCDSIVTLNLMVSASITGTEVVTICQGQSYTFNGINYSSNNNTAKDTFVTTGGCDSIVTLNLIVAPALTHTINPSICQGQSYSFGGTNYTTTQTGVQHTFVTTGGCDSIVTLNLTVAPALTHTINPSICQGQSYSFGGTSYTTSQTGVQHTFVTAGGCDSIVTLNLTVSPALTHTINPSICQGQSYSFGGTNYTTTQTGIQHTFVTTGGCDSIVTLNLTVAPALTHTVNPSICQGQSYSFGGTNYTTSQTGVQHTFVTTGGCDSIVTLNLMVTPTTVPFITVSNTATNNTICSGTLVSFTANITHGGTNPIFIWHKNGNIVGNNSNNYSDNTLNNTDVISASLVSNALCRTTDTVHSATTTFIVNSIPNASASINNPSICSGTAATIALTSTVMNTTFTWTTNQVGATGASNGTGSSINQTLNNTNNINGTITYTITPTANNCTGTPISAVITVKPKPAVIPSPSTQSICSGTQTSIALSAAVNNTTFSWSVSNNNVTGSSIGTGNTIGQTLVATTSVAGTTTYTITPTANSCVGNNSTVIVTVTPIPSSPTILTGPITPCVGSTVTYTTPTIPGATSYIWTLPNGWTGTSTTNTINATLANSNGMVMVQSQNSCGVSVSTAMLNVNPLPVLTPNINIASDVLIPHCSGTLIHFTASSNNQGSNPLLQWRVNGNNVGSNNNTYAYVAADNDVVTCVLNSNYPCLTNNNVVSNALTMNVTPTVYPDMHIYVVENHLCSGMPVHFVGTPTEEGTAPIYQWKVNNINMGSTSTNFTYTPNDGDQVICELTSNAVCASPPYVLSNMVPMTVVVSTTPSINITDNRNGVYTNGEPITFTATVSGQGTNGHQISWFKNDIVIPGEIGTTLILLGGTQIKNNHVITARLLSLSPCATPDHAISNAIKVSNTTSIQDVNVPEHFKLYPNPTENTIYIEGLNPDDHIKVVDALGRTMQQHTVDKMGTFILDLNKEAQGMYWLQFYSKDYRSWQVKVNKL
jgi:hypothetical protein